MPSRSGHRKISLIFFLERSPRDVQVNITCSTNPVQQNPKILAFGHMCTRQYMIETHPGRTTREANCAVFMPVSRGRPKPQAPSSKSFLVSPAGAHALGRQQPQQDRQWHKHAPNHRVWVCVCDFLGWSAWLKFAWERYQHLHIETIRSPGPKPRHRYP